MDVSLYKKIKNIIGGFLRVVILLGANATGKSTRMTKVVDSLGEKYTPLKLGEKEVGRYYPIEKIAIIGKRNKSGKWISMDFFPLQKWEERFPYFEEIGKQYEIETLLMEGYFNMVAKAALPANWRKYGYNKVDMFFLFYDKVEELLARVNERAQDNQVNPKTMEWAKNSSAWKDNIGRIRKGFQWYSESKEENDTVQRLDIDESPFFLVDFLGLKRVVPTTVTTKQTLDDF
jgi:hypothetical protein